VCVSVNEDGWTGVGRWKLRQGVVVFMINAVRNRQRGRHIKLAYYSQGLQIQIKKGSQDVSLHSPFLEQLFRETLLYGLFY